MRGLKAFLLILIALTVVFLLTWCLMRLFDDSTSNPPNSESFTEPPTTDWNEEIVTQEPPTPILDLDEGNETYLDPDVVARLEAMDEDGDEKTVNRILDAEILLINHFVKQGYSQKALYQIQRFYLLFYEQLNKISFDQLIFNITTCIPSDGADESNFPKKIADTFGWNFAFDISYIFEREVSV